MPFSIVAIFSKSATFLKNAVSTRVFQAMCTTYINILKKTSYWFCLYSLFCTNIWDFVLFKQAGTHRSQNKNFYISYGSLPVMYVSPDTKSSPQHSYLVCCLPIVSGEIQRVIALIYGSGDPGARTHAGAQNKTTSNFFSCPFWIQRIFLLSLSFYLSLTVDFEFHLSGR